MTVGTATASKVVLNGSEVKALLCDIDGTLTDSNPVHFKVYVLRPYLEEFNICI